MFDSSLHSNALGQVAGLVHIRPPRTGRVVRKQLQRHDMQQWAQCAVVLGHANHVDALTAFDAGVAIGQHVQHTRTGADFLHVALELLQEGVVGRHRHHRHGAGHQGQGAVLEFTGRVGFSVDVADFLELGELFAKDALNRNESCGGHFREESVEQSGEQKGEALRDDVNFKYAAAWEYKGAPKDAQLHKEELTYDNIELKTRSYK